VLYTADAYRKDGKGFTVIADHKLTAFLLTSDAVNRWPLAMTSSQHAYEVRPRKDKRGFDLISDALPFGRLWYTEIPHAVGYAKFRS
jgi:hypothetical protein